MKCNPSCYVVSFENVDELMSIASREEVGEIAVMPRGLRKPMFDPEGKLVFLKGLLESCGRLYASHYRPGASWEDEVFVCPACVHATKIQYAEVDEGGLWYCKYCYSHWECSKERGLYKLQPVHEEKEE